MNLPSMMPDGRIRHEQRMKHRPVLSDRELSIPTSDNHRSMQRYRQSDEGRIKNAIARDGNPDVRDEIADVQEIRRITYRSMPRVIRTWKALGDRGRDLKKFPSNSVRNALN